MTTGIHSPYQVQDYLSQVMKFSRREGVPKIIQKTVGDILEVDPSTVSRFLSGPKEGILTRRFAKKYPEEIAIWPEKGKTIGRALVKADALFFLKLPGAKAPVKRSVKAETDKSVSPEAKSSTSAIRKLSSSESTISIKLETKDSISKKEPKIKVAPSPTPIQLPRIPRISARAEATPKAPIVIGYRGHATDKDGAGMLFDHMCYQKATRHPTRLSCPEEIQRKVERLFGNAISDNPTALEFGSLIGEGKRLPETLGQNQQGGLLVIPGRVHKTEEEPVRLSHEYKIIREALRQGQPILAVCAGAWRLVEQVRIAMQHPDKLTKSDQDLVKWHNSHRTLVDVTDHNYNGGMIRLDSTGAFAVMNVQVHQIRTKRGTLLRDVMEGSGENSAKSMSVNSVHWKAINPEKLPSFMQISAFSKEDPDVTIKSRSGKLMEPDENAVEAIESKYGVPIFGIQWHPEGYNIQWHPKAAKRREAPKGSMLHVNLLRYMALAGDAYAAKKKMLQELKNLNLKKD